MVDELVTMKEIVLEKLMVIVSEYCLVNLWDQLMVN